MKPSSTDLRLVERIIEKDRTALETLYNRYERLLYRAAFMTSGSEQKAEAAVADLFMEIWTFPHAFLVQGDMRFSSMFLNKCLDKCKPAAQVAAIPVTAHCHFN
ncbi:RNA polymerase sigma factor [Fictibacillus iocasae]|uniref:RNA polymerase sigma factor n=1 Tax=Fictibacillus iocasae TaxID=2715437 RepID=A0ABW2NZ11_9BACL